MRRWVYETLANDPAIQAVLAPTLLPTETVADRVFGKNSMRTSEVRRPFLVYSLGVTSAEGLHDEDEGSRQFFQVWIHDEPSDYQLIDDLVAAVIGAFKGKSSPQYSVMTVLWLENSQEFDDQTMNTVFRYVRFQAVRRISA